MKIDPTQPQPIYQQIVKQLKDDVLSARLRPGDRVLPVREFAVHYRINPNTVNRAYKILQAEGFLESRPGGGNFIAGLTPEKRAAVRRERFSAEIAGLLRRALDCGLTPEEFLELVRRQLPPAETE